VTNNADVKRLDPLPCLLSETNAACFFSLDHRVRVVPTEDIVVVVEGHYSTDISLCTTIIFFVAINLFIRSVRVFPNLYKTQDGFVVLA